ncbi:MAG: PAS domain-containing sensor histidine kinase [Chloroflexi bacterium]|nr:PAS domain-containing sensor histidine kinase [Chloroflexota bacterium]
MYEIDVPSEVQDHSPTQGAWVWSLRSGVMRWSHKMFEIFGVNERQFDTTIENYSRLIHPADRRRVQVALMQGIREGSIGPFVYRIVRPDGEQRTVEAVIRMEYDIDGVIRRVSGVLTDVTERSTGGTSQASAAVTKPFNATTALIDEWRAFGRDMADRRGLAFECRIGDRVPADLPFDNTLLTQIVNQLLRNACQFTARGKVGLSIALRDSVLEIRVCDTGAGIPPHATILALRGQRLHSTTTGTDEDETGHGLPMVRSYVERLGGSLMVASTIGAGSTFTVTLPLPTNAPGP